jgi:hypothetical protein
MAETETTPETSAEARGWIEKLADKPKQFAMVEIGLAVALAALTIWLATTYGMSGIEYVIYAGVLLLVVGVDGASYSLYEGTASRPVDQMRIRLLAVGGLIGLATALFGVSLGYNWWDDLRSWASESGPKEKAWHAYVVVGVLAAGLVIMFAAFQLARTEERANPFLRRLLYGYNAALTGVLLLAVLLVVNVFLNIWSKTPLDFTTGGSFTLSPQSQNILKSLDKPVQITQVHGFRNAFFLESEVKTLLDNCRDLSDKVEIKELSLHQDQQRARELAKKYPGIEPGCILVVYGEGDSANWRVIEEKDLVAEPDRFDPNPTSHHKFQGEDALMTALTFLGENKKMPAVYFTQGHNELDLNDSSANRFNVGAGILKRRLEKRNFEVKPLTFDPVTPQVPEDATLVIIAGPRTPIPESEVKALREYMNRKGRLIVLVDPIVGADKKMISTGLDGLLAQYSVEIPAERIITMPVNFPLEAVDVLAIMNPRLEQNPLVTYFGTTRLEFEDCRPVRAQSAPPGASRFNAQPLILVGSFSWAEANVAAEPSRLVADIMRNEEERAKKIRAIRSTMGSLAVAVAVTESNFNPNDPHAMMRGPTEQKPRMVVFGTAGMASNRNMAEQAGTLNFDLLASTIDWLRDRPNTIGIAAKQRNAFVLVRGSDAEDFRMKYLPIMLVAACVLGLATGVWIVRRR